MFADTPPTVLGVPPALTADSRAIEALVDCLHQELQRRPVWVVLPTSPALQTAKDYDEQAAVLANDARWHAQDDPALETARIVQSHLLRYGVELTIAGPDDHERVPRISALVPNGWDGVELAQLRDVAQGLGSTEIRVIHRSAAGLRLRPA